MHHSTPGSLYTVIILSLRWQHTGNKKQLEWNNKEAACFTITTDDETKSQFINVCRCWLLFAWLRRSWLILRIEVWVLYTRYTKKQTKQRRKKECKYVDRTYSCLMSHLPAVVSKRTSGWTLLLLLQQQPWRRLKPQQAGEVPSSHIAHLPHSAAITSWSPPQPPDTIFSQRGDNCSADQRSDETASEGKWRMMMMMTTDVHFLILLV